MKFTMIALYSQLNALHLKISQKLKNMHTIDMLPKFVSTNLPPWKCTSSKFECCTTTKYLFELLDNVNNFKIVLSIN